MKKLENELGALKQRVVDMGELTETMLGATIKLLSEPQNEALDRQIRSHEEQLDKMQLDIDHEAIRMLTVYGPVAGNLRLIMSVSRITAELERIGDHSVNMCEALQLMTAKTDALPLLEVRNMARSVSSMLHDALAAFHQEDARLAETIVAKDDLVDTMYDQVTRQLLSDEAVREALSGPQDVSTIFAQLLIARSLERIADQSTNVSEEVVYMVQGADVRHALGPLSDRSDDNA